LPISGIIEDAPLEKLLRLRQGEAEILGLANEPDAAHGVGTASSDHASVGDTILTARPWLVHDAGVGHKDHPSLATGGRVE
jgi:hypothetical protein